MDYAGPQPDFSRIVELWWSGGYEADAFCGLQTLASNVIIGTNPAYTLSDFLAVYPKFFGTPTTITATLTANSNQMVVTSSLTGINLSIGQFLTAPGIPNGTTIIGSTNSTTFTLSNPATTSGTGVSVNVYITPFLPILVIQIYINLARSSVMQARWQDAWQLGMALYVAHYCTLWMGTETGPNSTAAQVAMSGMETGIALSQSVGDVSYSAELPGDTKDWGEWNLTRYGQQFIQFARVAGSGFMWIP
jgi:hypothetical protein